MELSKVKVALDDGPRLPTEHEASLARESGRVLSLHVTAKSEERCICVVDEQGEHAVVKIPTSAYRLLLDILAEMAMGNAVTVTPVHAVLTTQEAADILNVSRPFFVKLLERGEIPYHKAGAHRRVYYKDILDHKEKIDSKRHEVLKELAEQAQALNMGY